MPSAAAHGDETPSVVLTFDDGFRDVFENAWPMLRDRELPFTIYLASAYVGGTMHWDGSTAKAAGPALTWDQLAEMVGSGLCTIGNHTHSHVRPELLTEAELDRCSTEIEQHLGVTAAALHLPVGCAGAGNGAQSADAGSCRRPPDDSVATCRERISCSSGEFQFDVQIRSSSSEPSWSAASGQSGRTPELSALRRRSVRVPEILRLRGPGGRPLRLAHLTTVDMSLSLLLGTELAVDVESGFDTLGISAPGPYVSAVQALGVRHVPVPSLTRSWDVRRDLRAT